MTVKYAFVDESGTMDDQEIMTVCLIVLDGKFVSRNLQKLIIKTLYPNRFATFKRKQTNSLPGQNLHYCEMDKNQRDTCAQILGSEKIQCYCCHYYHTGTPKTHEERFSIYKNMLKSCILRAFETHNEIDICVAAQGSSNTAKAELLSWLRELPSKCSGYTKVKFGLVTGANEGVQLADFYAGAYRDYLRANLLSDYSLEKCYDVIKFHYAESIVETGVIDSH